MSQRTIDRGEHEGRQIRSGSRFLEKGGLQRERGDSVKEVYVQPGPPSPPPNPPLQIAEIQRLSTGRSTDQLRIMIIEYTMQ